MKATTGRIILFALNFNLDGRFYNALKFAALQIYTIRAINSSQSIRSRYQIRSVTLFVERFIKPISLRYPMLLCSSFQVGLLKATERVY
jgi:hypothetical protein